MTEREVLAQKIASRMTQAYERDRVGTAHLCDDILDRSGNMLGWIRELTAIAKEDTP